MAGNKGRRHHHLGTEELTQGDSHAIGIGNFNVAQILQTAIQVHFILHHHPVVATGHIEGIDIATASVALQGVYRLVDTHAILLGLEPIEVHKQGRLVHPVLGAGICYGLVGHCLCDKSIHHLIKALRRYSLQVLNQHIHTIDQAQFGNRWRHKGESLHPLYIGNDGVGPLGNLRISNTALFHRPHGSQQQVGRHLRRIGNQVNAGG